MISNVESYLWLIFNLRAKVWVANTYVVNYVFSAGFKAQLIKLIDVGMKKPKQPSNNHL